MPAAVVGSALLQALADRARDGSWLAFWQAVAFVGSSAFFTAALPLLFAFLPWPKALRVAAAFGLAVVASEWLKAVVDRPRPDLALFGVEGPLEPIGEFESAAFPSGHAAVGTAFWGTLARVAGGARAAGAATVLILLIAFSRLALLRHDLLDVVGGLILGAAVLVVTALADRRGLVVRLGALPWVEQAGLWLLIGLGLQWLAGVHSITVVSGVVAGLGAGCAWAAARPKKLARMGVGRALLRFALGLAGAVAARATGALLPVGMGGFFLYFAAGLWVGGLVPALTGGAYERGLNGAAGRSAAADPPPASPDPGAGPSRG